MRRGRKEWWGPGQNEHRTPPPKKNFLKSDERQCWPENTYLTPHCPPSCQGHPLSQEMSRSPALRPGPNQKTRRKSWFSKARETHGLSPAPARPLTHPPCMFPAPASCHIPDLPSHAFLPHRARTSPRACCGPPSPTHTLPYPGSLPPCSPSRIWDVG